MSSPFDKNKIAPAQFAPRLYCYVSTRSTDLAARLRAKADANVQYAEIGNAGGRTQFLFVSPRRDGDKLILASVTNDLGDFDLARMTDRALAGKPVDDVPFDSNVALSCNDAAAFACASGYWGIMTHYWHHDADTFVCSNNVFLTAGIAGDELSEPAMFEYLFFGWPRKEKTWFKAVSSLQPGQQLKLDVERHAVELLGGTDFDKLLDPEPLELLPTVREFFSKAKQRIGRDRTTYISLSSGSDSRTVLSCLRGMKMQPHAISFGNFNMLETRDVAELTHQLHVPWLFVDLAEFPDRFDELFAEGTFFSNGLLNPLRTHYPWLYSHMRRGNAVFEGILGSEFIKGEIAMPPMASPMYRDIITLDISLEAALGKYYPEMPEPTRQNLTSYIRSEYSHMFVNVNTPEGARSFQRYLLEDIPRRFFAGIIKIASQNSTMGYYPFLSPRILQAVFSNDCGMRKGFSLQKDFVGPIASLRAEALIVKEMDEEIFNSTLDRGVSFRDVLAPAAVAKTRRKMNLLEKKIRIGSLFGGQIDNSRVVDRLHEPALTLECPTFPGGLSNKNCGDLLAKAVVNYSQVRELARAFKP